MDLCLDFTSMPPFNSSRTNRNSSLVWGYERNQAMRWETISSSFLRPSYRLLPLRAHLNSPRWNSLGTRRYDSLPPWSSPSVICKAVK